MFVPMPPGLEEGRAAKEFVAPPPGLAPPAPYDQVPAPPPGLEHPGPLPCVGNLLLALSRCDEPAPSPTTVWQGAPAAPLKLHEALAPGAAPHAAAGEDDGPVKVELGQAGAPAQDLDGGHSVMDILQDDAEAEALLRPVLNDVIGRRDKGNKQAAGGASRVRWWARPDLPLLCPLTRFPICLLPYPPFKLRIDPKRSSPHRLVDGKFLAMHVIVTGSYSACGRELEASDLSALDDYVHRCKLGPYRPGRAASLAKEAAEAETQEQRQQAAQEHERFVAAARAELGKLRRIQENRLLQISKVLPVQQGAGPRSPHQRSRLSSGASTASTAASSNGDE